MQQGVVEVSILEAAVKLVGPAAKHDGQPSAGGMPEFSRHSGGVGFDFGYGVDTGGDHAIGAADRAGDGLFGAEAVQVIAHGTLALAVEVEPVDDLRIGEI